MNASRRRVLLRPMRLVAEPAAGPRGFHVRRAGLVVAHALVLIAVLTGTPSACQRRASGSAPPSDSSAPSIAEPASPASALAVTSLGAAPYWDLTNAFLHAAERLRLPETQLSARYAIRRLDDELAWNQAETATLFRNIRAGVAAQIRSGRTDATRLCAGQALLEKAMEKHVAKERDTLNALHVVLDRPLRSQLRTLLRGPPLEPLDDSAHGRLAAERVSSPALSSDLDEVMGELELTD